MQRELAVLVVLLWVVAAAGQTSVDAKQPLLPNETTDSRSAVVAEGTAGEARHSRMEGEAKEESPKDTVMEKTDKNRFFGRYRTTTETSIVMVTSTVFFSCLSGTSAAVCQGRRRKKDLAPLTELHFDHEERHYLDSSQETDASRVERSTDEDLEAPAEEKDDKGDNKFLGFQIWTRTRTTSTVTMLYTDTNTTIRLSYYCQAGSLQLPANSCG